MKQKIFDSKEQLAFTAVIIALVLAFSFWLFGFTGARVVLGIVFVSIPFFMILGNFGISEGERFVFAILLGLAIFPSLAYILGLEVSFRLSIALAFVIFIAIFFVLRYWKKK